MYVNKMFSTFCETNQFQGIQESLENEETEAYIISITELRAYIW